MEKHDKLRAIFNEYRDLVKTASFQEQETFLRDKIVNYSSEEPDDNLGLCALYSQIGGLYRAYSKLDEAENAFVKAKELLEDSGDERSFNYVTVLNNLAGLYYAAKKSDQALELFNKSIRICENGTNVSVEAFVSALNNKGLILQERGENKEAEKIYNRALKLAKHLKDGGRQLATTFSNLAFVNFASGEKEAAIKYMDEALMLFDEKQLSKNDTMYKQLLLIRARMINSR